MAAAVTASRITIIGTMELHQLVIEAIARGAIVVTAPRIQFVLSEPIPAEVAARYVDPQADKVIFGVRHERDASP